MPDLLIELRSEEIPARMQRRAAADLKSLVTDGLVSAGLTYEAAREYWTPRRLVLDLRGIVARSSDLVEERKGPRTDAPDQAIAGFLRGAGLSSVAEAEVRTDAKKGDYLVALIRKPGREAGEIIAEILPRILAEFPWPKSMRWGAASAKPGSLRWIRPLQSILCTFGPETADPEIIPFEIDGIRAGNATQGHRFHSPETIHVRRFDDFVEKLKKARVILDAERRKEIILADARNLAFANGLELVEDDALLEEVSGLVEWPVVLIGEFEDGFLEIPAEVIRLTIKTNQKCFVTRAGDGSRLANRFILVANIEARDGGEEIALGNARVVRARLSDAVHFWKTDQADLPDLDRLGASAASLGLDLKKPLDQRMARLDQLGVTFHAMLGTQGERVRRIATLAGHLAGLVGADASLCRRAAMLCKADLQTEVVGEFPELQGVMGRKYAELQGEPPSVAAAIEEHYRPQGPTDAVPADPVSVAVALADKLDMLFGFWAINEKPTGSKDPYGLRRAALGVVRIVLENGIRLDLLSLSRWIIDNPSSRTIIAKTLPADPRSDLLERYAGDLFANLLSFFHDRLKVYLRDAGRRHDLIDAVITSDAGDLLTITRRVEALETFLASEDGANLLIGTKRAANILAAEEKKGTAIAARVDPALFEQDEERALLDSLEEAEGAARAAIAAEEYEKAMGYMADLRHPIDAFFDTVLVNAPEEALRANRLALLARIRSATAEVADFSRIAG